MAATNGPTVIGRRGPARCANRPAEDDSSNITIVIGISALPDSRADNPTTRCS